MKAYWGNGGISSRILDLGTRWRWSASRPGRYTPRERVPGTHWIGGWVGPRAILDAVVKRRFIANRRVYRKLSGLADWSENCKQYSSLPLGAVVSLFYESVLESFVAITFCVAFNECLLLFLLFISLSTQSRNFWIHLHIIRTIK
jgi:hypothetical protein